MSSSVCGRCSAPLRLTLGDALLVLAVLGLTVALVAVQATPAGPAEAVVFADDGELGRFDLQAPRVVRATGPLGETVIEIAAGAARILTSPCPHEFCAQRGWVRHPGQVSVCVPNGVILEIAGRPSASQLDGVSR